MAAATIGFLGAGMMGQAMVQGLIAQGTAPADIIAYDPSAACLDKVTAAGSTAAHSAKEVYGGGVVVIFTLNYLEEVIYFS